MKIAASVTVLSLFLLPTVGNSQSNVSNMALQVVSTAVQCPTTSGKSHDSTGHSQAWFSGNSVEFHIADETLWNNVRKDSDGTEVHGMGKEIAHWRGRWADVVVTATMTKNNPFVQFRCKNNLKCITQNVQMEERALTGSISVLSFAACDVQTAENFAKAAVILTQPKRR